MTVYIDSDGTELDDSDLHERYDQWLNDLYPEVEIGHSVFEPAEILKELEPITYRVGFSDFLDFMREDDSIIDMDDSPVCEDCDKKLSKDEVVESLGNHGYLVCESCGEDKDCDICGLPMEDCTVQ